MFENLVGLQVVNEKLYREYRKEILPILREHGGDFGYDFKVAEVLINQSGNPINRVFTIYFPDKDASNKFFSNSKYLKSKKQYFDKAIECTTIISQYER